MMRCLECGCSRLDPKGYKCALCGGAPSVRSEQCYITEDTKSKLLAHGEDLKAFGVKLEEITVLQKNAGGLEIVALAIAVADSLTSGFLRKLVLFLREIAISDSEIIRLRLDEPEKVLEILASTESDDQS